MEEYLNYFVLGYLRVPLEYRQVDPHPACPWMLLDKCAFCTTELDWFKGMSRLRGGIVDKMEKMYSQTGSNGFHFIDEAMPLAC